MLHRSKIFVETHTHRKSECRRYAITLSPKALKGQQIKNPKKIPRTTRGINNISKN